MGLDMYLNRKIYLGKDWDGKRVNQTIKLDDMYGKPIEIETKDLKELVFDAGYWRKANAIHNWFVQNVQDGDDNCKEYYVEREQLQELLDLVNEVLKGSELEVNAEGRKVIKNTAKAERFLPSESGFFFGSTEYDEWYLADLVNTKEILEKALADTTGSDFYYDSSW